MDSRLTYYEILGVGTSASVDEIQRACDAKMAALAPRMISGAPSKVVAAADRARLMLDLARRTLTDPQARQLHDTEVGILRPGSGLVRPEPVPSEPGLDPLWPNPLSEAEMAEAGLALLAEALAPHRRLSRHVVVPDARGLFVGPARRMITLCGLHADLAQLTRNPVPVEGLVVEQSARPGEQVRRSSTVTLQVWHPPQRR